MKNLGILLAIMMTALVACTPKEYEYKTVSTLPTQANATIKRMTTQGWELVSQQTITVANQNDPFANPFSTLKGKDYVEILFKRPKR